MKCVDCEYCEKIALNIPQFCTYGGRKTFLFGWDPEKDQKTEYCPYRLKVVNEKQFDKEELVKWLIGKDVNVLRVAIAYAENYLKYGVNVVDKVNTATEMANMMKKARRYGYMERVEDERKIREQDLHRGSVRGNQNMGEGEPEVFQP